MIFGNCEHAFQMVKSNNSLIHWICNLCHSGPHWFIFECQRCELRTCRPCSLKALAHRGYDRQNDEGTSEQPRQHPPSPDHGARQARSDARQEQRQAAEKQTKQPLTVPIRTTRDEIDEHHATASGGDEETTSGELFPSVLRDTKELLVDRLMEQFHGLLQEFTDPPSIGCTPCDIVGQSGAGRACTVDSGSPISSGSSRDSLPHTQASASELTAGVKKRRKERSSTNGDERDDEDDGERQRMTSPQVSEVKDVWRKFACPFAKRYTGRTPRFTVCAYPGWSTTHRVKEHLYRRHVQHAVIQCPRCYEEFGDVIFLEHHVRKAERCVERERPLREEGLDCNQEKSLRCRKRMANTSEEEKWKRVYRICFPDVTEADIPSPYVDYARGTTKSFDLTPYQHFLNEKLPELLRQEVRKMVESHPMWPQIAEDLSRRRLEILDRCLDRFVENESLAEHSRHVEENNEHAPTPATPGDVEVSSTCINSTDDSHEAPLVSPEAPVLSDLHGFLSDTNNALTLDQICNLNTSMNKKSSRQE